MMMNINLRDFVMASENNTDDLVGEIRRTIKDMKDPHLKNLLKSFFCDKNFTELFYKAPAAIVHHHNYLGGLLDYTVEVLRIGRTACEIFPDLIKIYYTVGCYYMILER